MSAHGIRDSYGSPPYTTIVAYAIGFMCGRRGLTIGATTSISGLWSTVSETGTEVCHEPDDLMRSVLEHDERSAIAPRTQPCCHT